MYYTLKDHQGNLIATIHGNTVERLWYDDNNSLKGESRNENITKTIILTVTLAALAALLLAEVSQEAIKALAFPNPAKNELNIDISGFTSLEGCRISITDALGRPCVDRFIRGEGNVLTVGVASLPVGVYTYQIYDNKKTLSSGKFVKE